MQNNKIYRFGGGQNSAEVLSCSNQCLKPQSGLTQETSLREIGHVASLLKDSRVESKCFLNRNSLENSIILLPGCVVL